MGWTDSMLYKWFVAFVVFALDLSPGIFIILYTWSTWKREDKYGSILPLFEVGILCQQII